ncbi:hypothetical protein C3B44_02780 [Corynebacterium yudongzhengii]|uniref:Uncharacterized protein n=1 Tax=Corynebacterium yudongzhengii TaxID=2080740 RepID=A0A2U1T525_9CORY|nr:hypothetical protein C3B44_02780 [Corynebacterium yudongzhengii]PWC01092.1 hypothetical protein DF222_09385 [Corynebacterium yudongzhengii]
MRSRSPKSRPMRRKTPRPPATTRSSAPRCAPGRPSRSPAGCAAGGSIGCWPCRSCRAPRPARRARRPARSGLPASRTACAAGRVGGRFPP